MSDLIDRQAAIDALGEKPLAWIEGEYEFGLQNQWQSDVNVLKDLPSAQPDFSCEGCQTPKHICGICMRNYPNITDHYTGGEAE